MVGHPVVGVVLCQSGALEHGERVLAPLLKFGPLAITTVQAMPYTAVQQLIDEANPEGMQDYWSGNSLAELPDEAVDVLTGLATQPVSPLTQIILVAGGGAIARACSRGLRRSGIPTNLFRHNQNIALAG